MADNGELYMRRTLKDTGTNTDWSPAAAKSPDIIPYGVATLADPQAFFKANYSKDLGQALIVNEPNHIYVRAKNIGAGPATGAIFLYYAESSMLLFPSMWQNNQLLTSGGNSASKIHTTEPGGIGVGEEPFVWSPGLPPGRFHYCFVGLAITDEPSPKIPSVKGIRDLAALNAEGLLTSRNVFFVDANAAGVAVETSYEQGATEEKIDFTINCVNCPVGTSWVQFKSTGTNPIQIPKTKITDSNFVTGISVTVPANLKTTFEIFYWSDSHPAADWQIDFVASMKVPPADPLFKHAKTPEEMGWKNADHLADAGGPVKSITLGTATLRNASIL